jgi:hypothetical protein
MECTIENVEAINQKDPSFVIPSKDVRHSRKVGSFVRLLFGFNAPSGQPNAETLWIEITETVGSRYKGKVENDPHSKIDIRKGDVVEFGPENIASHQCDCGKCGS